MSGPSVDWYAREFESQMEALGDQVLRSTGASALQATEAQRPQSSAVPTSKHQEELPVASLEAPRGSTSAPIAGTFEGVWQWQAENDARHNHAPQGLLIIHDANGKLSGNSFVELKLKDGPSPSDPNTPRTVITSSLLGGRSELLDNGRWSAGFSTVNEAGLKTVSVVELSADGNEMFGTSTQQVHTEPGNGKLSEYAYRWAAKRSFAAKK